MRSALPRWNPFDEPVDAARSDLLAPQRHHQGHASNGAGGDHLRQMERVIDEALDFADEFLRRRRAGLPPPVFPNVTDASEADQESR